MAFSSVFSTFILLLLVSYANCISFNFNFSDPDFDQFDNIKLEGDALWNRTVISLTRDSIFGDLLWSQGRESYKHPMLLWNNTSGEVSNFTTNFTFFIKSMPNSTYPTNYGDGIAFFLSPYPSQMPEGTDAAGGCLSLIHQCSAETAQIVAVEFDTWKNFFDYSNNHVGIDVQSISSIAYQNIIRSIRNGNKISATINYNSATKNLSVLVSFDDDQTPAASLSASVDLKSVFNISQVAIGFSSATGRDTQLHHIFRWSLDSSFEFNSTPKSNSTFHSNSTRFNMKLIVGLSVGLGSLMIILGLACCCFGWYRSKTKRKEDEEPMLHNGLGLGPRRIPYRELGAATLSFDETKKLGQGGFGSVYKGILGNSNRYVAIKKLAEDSRQGEKEFISEVSIISRLAHKNLVELQGWCHDGKSYLLVYEFMPNGSLDNYLYNTEHRLNWLVRYNIAIDLADAILYLHEKYRKCVIHRDIKPSNIMLDPKFNAKLGDFGLARFVEHDKTMKTTHLAGTLGYVAPECFQTGKSTTLSDVYSYGVILLEMSCGKPPNA
ncbi:hypothetical protein LUZ60_013805 [Juncus effusus]|nr:hypothetical protein LUZ60_013805 [Juncus effusus]